jgi:hypothetical protein
MPIHPASFDAPDRDGVVGDDRGVVHHVRVMTDHVSLISGLLYPLYGFPQHHLLYEPVAETATLTPANIEVGDIFTILYDGADFAIFVATDGLVKTVVEGLQAAWTAATAAWTAAHPEGAGEGPDRIVATEDDTKVTLNIDTDGTAFAYRITTSAVDGGGADTQTLTKAVPVMHDTSYLQTDVRHVLGPSSIKFSKLDGPANSKFAGFSMNGIDYDLTRFIASALINARFYVPTKTNIVAVFVAFGTDKDNHNLWTLAEAGITAGVWQKLSVPMGDTQVTVVGKGWDQKSVKYAAFYVEFNAENITKADMLLDHVSIDTSMVD